MPCISDLITVGGKEQNGGDGSKENARPIAAAGPDRAPKRLTPDRLGLGEGGEACASVRATPRRFFAEIGRDENV